MAGGAAKRPFGCLGAPGALGGRGRGGGGESGGGTRGRAPSASWGTNHRPEIQGSLSMLQESML